MRGVGSGRVNERGGVEVPVMVLEKIGNGRIGLVLHGNKRKCVSALRAGAKGGPQSRLVQRNDTALYCEAMKAGRQTKQPAEGVRRAVNFFPENIGHCSRLLVYVIIVEAKLSQAFHYILGHIVWLVP